MIVGEVTPNREAILRLTLRGLGGQEAVVEAVVDTGFTEYLTLPEETIATLDLLSLDAVDGGQVRITKLT